MSHNLEQRVECLLAELDLFPVSAPKENETRRSEILEEILSLVALSLSAEQRAQRDAERGRWV